MKREIKPTSQYRRDLKRFRHNAKLLDDVADVVDLLASDALLDPSLDDHPLHNNWEGCRDCHIRPDVVLIYEKTDTGLAILRLLRLGSHSELF